MFLFHIKEEQKGKKKKKKPKNRKILGSCRRAKKAV